MTKNWACSESLLPLRDVKALLGADVLHQATPRSLLIDLSLQGLYQAHWTDRLHDEWTRNLLLNRPDLDPAKLQRTRELMDRAIVTQNLRDFPVEVLEPLGLQAIHPDQLARAFLARDPALVLAALRTGRARFWAPPLSAPEMLKALALQGLGSKPLLPYRVHPSPALKRP